MEDLSAALADPKKETKAPGQREKKSPSKVKEIPIEYKSIDINVTYDLIFCTVLDMNYALHVTHHICCGHLLKISYNYETSFIWTA